MKKPPDWRQAAWAFQADESNLGSGLIRRFQSNTRKLNQ